MRRSKQDTAATRRHIVATAATALRVRGLDSASVSEIMSDAGLTHGGFYRHFGSRDALLAEACSVAVDTATGKLAAVAAHADGEPLATLAAFYLSSGHRDDVGSGCPFAAFGSELPRAPAAVSEAATEGLRKFIAIVADTLDEPTKPQAAAITAMLVGAMTLARLVNDKDLSASLLTAANVATRQLGKLVG